MNSRVSPSDTRVIEVDDAQMTHKMMMTHEMQQFASDHTLVDIFTNDSSGKEEMLAACDGIFSPILKTMKLFGVYFGETSLKRISSLFCQSRRRLSISLLYCCATKATIWFYVAMTLISLCMEGTTELSFTFRLTSTFVFSVLTALRGTICMFVLPLTEAKQSRFENFIRSLIECKAELGKLRSVSRKSLILAGLAWITSTLFAIISVLFFPSVSTGTFKPWDIWYGFSITSVICHILGCGASLLPVSLFCTTCLVLGQLFNEFSKKASTKNLNSWDLTALKDEHRKLCGVVELASEMFSPLLFILFSLYISLLCFVFYVALKLRSLIIASLYVLITSAGKVAILLVFGTRVNEKASNN